MIDINRKRTDRILSVEQVCAANIVSIDQHTMLRDVSVLYVLISALTGRNERKLNPENELRCKVFTQ